MFEKIIHKIEIYGDSIMKGVLLNRETNRYYIGIKENFDLFEQKYMVDVGNNARFGFTVTKGYSQLERDLDRGLRCDVVLLEYGGNDCDFNWSAISESPDSEHEANTPLPLFIETYKKVIALLRKNGITPILTNLPPMDAAKYLRFLESKGLSAKNILKWLGDVSMMYRFQEMYSHHVECLARETNCPIIDIRNGFLTRHDFKELFCDDGIHPSEKGHGIIANAIDRFASSFYKKDALVIGANESIALP